MNSFKTITQEEAEGLWKAGVRDLSYEMDTTLYVDGAMVQWMPFTTIPYIWESPKEHWSTTWRVETE